MKKFLMGLFTEKTDADRFVEGALDLADLERRQTMVRNGWFADRYAFIANLQAAR